MTDEKRRKKREEKDNKKNYQQSQFKELSTAGRIIMLARYNLLNMKIIKNM